MKAGIRVQIFPLILTLVFAGLAGGCASAAKQPPGGPGSSGTDSMESVNRPFYEFNETLDQYLMEPVAQAYVYITPSVLRAGVTNFFNNIVYLNVVANSFLQGKLDDGFSDSFRFLFNSTLGIGGLIDVATPMGIERHEEDAGQTLARWGTGQGSYLFLPFLGPNTVRNLPDFATNYLLNPLSYVSGTVMLPVTILNVVNTRASLLEATRLRDQAAVDGYVFTREAYLQRRLYLIHDGNPPVSHFDDLFSDPAAGETDPARE